MLIKNWGEYNDLLDKIGTYYIAQLKSDLKAEGHYATGKLSNSITKEVINQNKLIIRSSYTNELGLLGLSEGRKKSGEKPSRLMVNYIKEWMKAKGIVRRIGKGSIGGGRFKKRSTESQITAGAFAMARGIIKRGYKGSNTIRTSFNKLEGRIGKEVLDAFTTRISEEFKNITIS